MTRVRLASLSIPLLNSARSWGNLQFPPISGTILIYRDPINEQGALGVQVYGSLNVLSHMYNVMKWSLGRLTLIWKVSKYKRPDAESQWYR